jgi:hypothetical protein
MIVKLLSISYHVAGNISGLSKYEVYLMFPVPDSSHIPAHYSLIPLAIGVLSYWYIENGVINNWGIHYFVRVPQGELPFDIHVFHLHFQRLLVFRHWWHLKPLSLICYRFIWQDLVLDTLSEVVVIRIINLYIKKVGGSLWPIRIMIFKYEF